MTITITTDNEFYKGWLMRVLRRDEKDKEGREEAFIVGWQTADDTELFSSGLSGDQYLGFALLKEIRLGTNLHIEVGVD